MISIRKNILLMSSGNSIVPVPVPEILGPELVDNGKFDADTNWVLEAGYQISDGSLNTGGTYPSLANRVYQTNVLGTSNVASSKFRIAFDVFEITQGSIQMQAGDAICPSVTATGHYEFDVETGPTNTIRTAYVNNGSRSMNGIVDNYSIKEIVQEATTPEILGDELIDNGTFDADTNWTWDGSSWSITGGVITTSGILSTGASRVYQSVFGADNGRGKTYKLRFHVIDHVGGTLQMQLGNQAQAAFTPAADTVYIYYITIDDVNTVKNIYWNQFSRVFGGSIDNVSVKEVIQSGS